MSLAPKKKQRRCVWKAKKGVKIPSFSEGCGLISHVEDEQQEEEEEETKAAAAAQAGQLFWAVWTRPCRLGPPPLGCDHSRQTAVIYIDKAVRGEGASRAVMDANLGGRGARRRGTEKKKGRLGGGFRK